VDMSGNEKEGVGCSRMGPLNHGKKKTRSQ